MYAIDPHLLLDSYHARAEELRAEAAADKLARSVHPARSLLARLVARKGGGPGMTERSEKAA